jgi:ceramide glucosyltransferase
LKENLASSFRLDYPNYEIIFSVASETDPAVQVVKELKEEYPDVDAKLIVGMMSFPFVVRFWDSCLFLQCS